MTDSYTEKRLTSGSVGLLPVTIFLDTHALVMLHEAEIYRKEILAAKSLEDTTAIMRKMVRELTTRANTMREIERAISVQIKAR